MTISYFILILRALVCYNQLCSRRLAIQPGVSLKLFHPNIKFWDPNEVSYTFLESFLIQSRISGLTSFYVADE